MSVANLVNIPSNTQKELIEKFKQLKPLEVWLFGSYAKGNPTASSDMDLFLVKKKLKPNFSDELVKLRSELREFEKKHNIEIDLFVDTKSNIKQKLRNNDEFYSSVFRNAQKIYTKNKKCYVWLNRTNKFDSLIFNSIKWLILIEKNYPI